jgi:hypothetical protein
MADLFQRDTADGQGALDHRLTLVRKKCKRPRPKR